MSLQLVDPSKEYWLDHASGARFLMRHWTVAMQELTDKECFSIVNEQASYNQSREREMKLSLAVVGWEGVEFGEGTAPCTDENKKLLPVGVVFWLIQDIDERAGLRMKATEKKT